MIKKEEMWKSNNFFCIFLFHHSTNINPMKKAWYLLIEGVDGQF